MFIAKALDKRDKYTSQHSERVSIYSKKIAAKLGMSADECENLRKVALLHDIGKIGVPDSILNKPDRLTTRLKGMPAKPATPVPPPSTSAATMCCKLLLFATFDTS